MAGCEREQLSTHKNYGNSRTPEGFGELATLHRSLMFSVAFRIVRNPQVAEDVTQEAMLKGFKAWPQFRGDCDPRAWLVRVVTNVAINHVVRNREFPDSISDRADESDLAGQVERRAMRDALRGEIDQLPLGLRQPLMMFEYDGVACEEIGTRLGITPGAVRGRLMRGRRHLTRQMLTWA